MLKKILHPFRSHVANLFFSMVITWIYTIAVLFITIPYITFSEASTPEAWMTYLHLALMTPALVYITLSILEHLQPIQSLRFLLYPFILFSIPIWVILTLLGFGATVLWFMLFITPLWLPGIPATFIYGLILDLKKKK